MTRAKPNARMSAVEMKDSGVEWLGEIPAHWDVKRLKFLTRKPLMYGANEAADDDNPNNPRYIRITDINDNGTLRKDTFRSLPYEIAAPYLLEKGDILFARSGSVGKTFRYQDSWGQVCFAGYLIKFSTDLRVVIPEFVDYFASSKSYWDWLNGISIKTTIQNVSAEKYANLKLGIPPLHEQRAIASYLDTETAKIDRLIGETERLTALLREKRVALISRAVTKGLDASAEMKESGVEWLGEIPRHWDIRNFKYIARLQYGDSLKAEDRVNGDVPVFGSNGLVGYHDVSNSLAPAIVVGRKGSFGKVNYSNNPVFAIDTTYFVDERTTSEVLRWVYYFLQILELDKTSKDSAVPGLGREEVYSLCSALPPLAEQRAIAAYLDHETAKIDALIDKNDKLIALLREKRTALISAAVTGKISVSSVVK